MNPYGLTDKQMEEIRKGNILGGRVVDGKFYADWNYDIEIPDSEFLTNDEKLNVGSKNER